MTFLRAEAKIELRCNVCNDITAEEECDVWCRAEKYSLIAVLNLMLFWVTDF